MLSSKADVDRHVAKALAKLKSAREKNFRSYSVARLYFDVNDYETCIRFVNQYLSVKDNNAAAHNLLGQAYKKLGQKDEALAAFKTSLELDPNQNNLILKVCELLADDCITTDIGCIRFWVDRGNAAFPLHPTVFKLSQRMLQLDHAGTAAIVNLLQERVAACPLNPSAHARLLRQLIECDRTAEAFNRAFDVQVANSNDFRDSLIWQDTILDIVDAYKNEALQTVAWNYWYLRLTAIDRKVFIQLGWRYSPADAVDAMIYFDRALFELSNCQKVEAQRKDLSRHFGGQFCLYGGTLLLKKALIDKCGWRELTRLAVPLLLNALQFDSNTTNKVAVGDWPTTAAYRVSQAGHTILACVKNKKQIFLDNVKQFCSDQQWRDKIFKALFNSKDKKIQSSSSYLANPKLFIEPQLKLPNVQDLLQNDLSARLFLSDSLHHQVWIGMNYDRLSKITSFAADDSSNNIDNLPNCGPETLSKIDMDAFLYCTILVAQQNLKNNSKKDFYASDRPSVLPATLVEPLCTVEQGKWWEYAMHISHRDAGSQNTDNREIITRGIETIRCASDHGLDPYLLSMLGRVFAQRAESECEKKRLLGKRAALYYSAALPLLERLKNQISVNPPKKRLFNFTYQDFNSYYINSLMEEAKLFLGNHYMNESDYDRAIEILTGVKSPYASFYLFQINMNLAEEQMNSKGEDTTAEMRTKRYSLLSKARHYIYLTSDRLKDSNADQEHPLSDVLSEHIENVESLLSSVEFESNLPKNVSDISAEEQSIANELSYQSNLITPERNRSVVKSSNTPRSLEAQIRQLQKKEVMFSSVVQQIGELIESNKLLREQVQQFGYSLEELKTHNSDSSEKRKFLSAIDGIRCNLEELRDENVTNTGYLKKEISHLRRDFEKLRLTPLNRREDDLFLFEDSMRAANNTSMPFMPRAPASGPPPNHNFPTMFPNVFPFFPGQYTNLPQMFQSSMFQPEQSMYQDLLIPPSHIPPPFAPPHVIPQPLPPTVPPPTVPPPIIPPVVFPVSKTVTTDATTRTTDNPQIAVHDYHIQLPATTPTIPSIVTTQTSTPNKPFDSTTKAFSFFDKVVSDSPQAIITTDIHSSSLNKSRTLSEKSNESIDPYPEYRPIVPLPDEITPITGEEDETALFDSRAKLFRFISGEWKERGLGQLKLLKSNTTGKVRLLMRRDTVHTVCANHIITPEIEICLMKGSDKAYFWVANDFADDTVTLEKFCVRFKTTEIGNKFFETFNSSKQQNSAIKTVTKPKENHLKNIFDKSWKCPECSTLNDESTKKCNICETANPTTENKPITSTPLGGFTFSKAPTFKIVNSAPETSEAVVETTKPNPFGSFTFTKPVNTASLKITKVEEPKITVKEIPAAAPPPPVVSGWGDQFKPKAGSWSCNSCYMNNNGTDDYCIACENPKIPGMPEKEKKPEATATTKFNFGIPAATNTGETPKTSFLFGINNQTAITKPTEFSFATNTPPKPANETPEKSNAFIIGSEKNEKYEFVFTPKGTMGKSPTKTSDDTQNDNEYAQEDEGHHITFVPVIDLPDKVDVKTGEEDELIVYSHRAKLFRYATGEWKECGTGDIKILQHKENKKIRVVMRREPILKICLNHALTDDIEYIVKDKKTWLFTACDFSTGEICAQQFCVRFVNGDVAIEFVNAINKAKKLIADDLLYDESTDTTKTVEKIDDKINKKVEFNTSIQNSFNALNVSNVSDDDEVEFVSETTVTNEEIEQARKLKLPDKFYAYKQLPMCSGCRGCSNEDDDAKINIKNSVFPNAEKAINFSMKETSYNIFSNSPFNNPNINPINKSGTFDFSGFSLTKTTSSSIFGGSPTSTANTTTTSIFPNAIKQPVFGSTTTTVFGSKPIFADSKCVLFENKAIFPNATQTAVNPTQPSSIFGSFLESPSIVFNAANNNIQPKKFDFAFGAPKDLNTSKSADKKNDSDLYQEEENNEIFFKPIIPLPDEVELKTGEEDEEVLYCHRAKLLRFADKEFKDCGVGDIKILLHKNTNKLRVLMRREPIMKICLNHTLTCDIEYIKKDEKSWLFCANDFSSEVFTPVNFCLRFVNAEVATEFRNAIDTALKTAANDTTEKSFQFTEDESKDNNKASFRGLAAPKFTFSNADKPPIVPSVVANTNVFSKPVSATGNVVFGAKPIDFMAKDNKENSSGSDPIQNKPVISFSTKIFGGDALNTSSDTIQNKPKLDEKALSFPTKIFGGDAINTPSFVMGDKLNSGNSANEQNYFSLAAKSLSATTNQENEENNTKTDEVKPFIWKEAGKPLFQSASKSNDENADDYDPHYAPIISLPDKIDVVTGEEDETIEFQKRAKLYRWSNGEWKERGTGQIKILHHPMHGSYRLLLRQDLVHKVVLNQLITADLQLLPLNSCPKSFMWMCINFTDDEQGALEKLAIRFSKPEFAKEFNDKIESIKPNLLSYKSDDANDPNNYEKSDENDDDEDYDEKDNNDDYYENS